MKNVAHARHRGPDGLRVAQIALDEFEVEAVEMSARAGRAHQGAHREAALDQLAGHGGADEAACSGDKNFICAVHEGCRNGMALGLAFRRSSGRQLR